METVALNCALCSLLGSDNGNRIRYLNKIEAKTHASIHFGHLKTLTDGGIEEEQMFDQCFLKTPRMDQEVAYPGRQSHVDLCRSLFGESTKRISIACNLCGCGMKIVTKGKYLTTGGIILHASIHAGAKPFECRRCEKSFRSRSYVQYHMKCAHGTKLADDFEDQSERFHDEISNSIKRCFTEFKDGAPSKEMKDKTREEIAVLRRRLMDRSKLSIQRHVFFNRTIRKRVNTEGKVQCRLCSKTINATSSVKPNGGGILKTENVIHHAHFHLRKPLYQCKMCNEFLTTYPAMVCHLRRKHKLGTEQNFSDILAIFAQCYEKDE